MFAQSAWNMSGCSIIRRECYKIDLHGAAEPIAPDRRVFPSGRESTNNRRKSEDYFIRREFWAGAKKSNIISPTSKASCRLIQLRFTHDPGNSNICSSKLMPSEGFKGCIRHLIKYH